MTVVTVSEFRRNIKKYSELVRDEDIIVVSNGKPIMKVSNPLKDKITGIKGLRGIISDVSDYESVLKKKLEEL